MPGKTVFPAATTIFRTAALGLVFAVLLACAPTAQPQAPKSPTPDSTPGVVRAVEVAKGLEHPWGLAFLPDGRMLVTERPGRLRIVDKSGKLSEPLSGVPTVFARGQGGLLDVVLHPEFAQNRYVYLSYSEPGEMGTSGTSVARGRLGATGLEDVEVIWRQRPKVRSAGHFGSRLVWRRDGTLFIALGDRQSTAERVKAQDLAVGNGKVMRIHADGSIPQDNPFIGHEGVQPEIWSYGHRNIQSAALHPETGDLWEVEHGPRGGDELNLVLPGRNYGWPVIGYGIEYSGARIHSRAAAPGMEQPVYYWDPVIAPSGMTFYTGDAFPEWKNNIFVGSLTPGALVRLELKDGRVVHEARYLGELGERIRDVRQGPDGLLYLLTDSPNGRLLRVERAGK
jgi:glucose/arabinose dehydrogenase